MSESNSAQKCRTDYTVQKTSLLTNCVIVILSGSNLLVVSLADASSKPDAVMIELHHTVIAQIAMGCPHWPEDIARLTKLKLVQKGRVRLIDVHVMDAGGFVPRGDIEVLIGQVALDCTPGASRHDSRLSRRRMNHKEVRQEEQCPEGTQCHFPSC